MGLIEDFLSGISGLNDPTLGLDQDRIAALEEQKRMEEQARLEAERATALAQQQISQNDADLIDTPTEPVDQEFLGVTGSSPRLQDILPNLPGGVPTVQPGVQLDNEVSGMGDLINSFLGQPTQIGGEDASVGIVPPLPSPGQIGRGILGAGAAGLGVSGALNLGGALSGSPDRRDGSDVTPTPSNPAAKDMQQFLIDQGSLPGIKTQEKPYIDPDMEATPKEQLATITGKNPESQTLMKDILSDFAGQPQQVQQALTDSIKEATGIDLGSFGDVERSLKFIDDSLNEAQKTQEQRLLQRENKSERVRQLAMKAGCPDCMTGGEKAAYIIAGAIPLIASAVTGQRVDPRALGKIGSNIDSAFAADKSKRASAEARQQKALLAAEKDLEQFDLRTIESFGKLAKQREGQIDTILKVREKAIKEAGNIQKLSQDDLKQFNTSNIDPNNIKAAQSTAAGHALTMDLSHNDILRLEEEFTLEDSGSRFARFNLADYIPTGGLKVSMLNELVPPEFRQLAQAQLTFMLAQLRKESGAAISQTEYADFGSKAFVFPGDDAQTIRQKQQFRQSVISSAETAAGPGALDLTRQNYVIGTLKPFIKDLGGRIKGGYIMLPDPDNPGQFQVGKAEDLLRALEGQGLLDSGTEENLDRLIRGL